MFTKDPKSTSNPQLAQALKKELENFQTCYQWLEKAMPPRFFKELNDENLNLITHSLMGFPTEDYFSTIHLKNGAIALALNTPEADLQILKSYTDYGIKSYRAYVSKIALPFAGIEHHLRIAFIQFTTAEDERGTPLPEELIENLKAKIKLKNMSLSDEDLDTLISEIDAPFLRSLPHERLILAIEMFLRSRTRDLCQYEVIYNEDWKLDSQEPASMHIVFAWKNTPKRNFLYHLGQTIHRHGLVITSANAAYVISSKKENTLIMSLGLHGAGGKEVWEEANIPDFVRELITFKYFYRQDMIEADLLQRKIITGNEAHLIRSIIPFLQQFLAQIDPYIYTSEHIEADLCRFPDLIRKVLKAFEAKFDPNHLDLKFYAELHKEILADIHRLDTGHVDLDMRRRTIFQQLLYFFDSTLKTNFFVHNFSALSFRLDPNYLEKLPFNRKKIFPEMPYAIFYIAGMHFFGFHIRFKELARGGLRTVYPENFERMGQEIFHVFSECYHLALTQQQKNKDIPEGGAKGIIFMKPFERIDNEVHIFKRELEQAKISQIDTHLETYRQKLKMEYMRQAQRSFIEAFMTLINYEPDGTLHSNQVIDYWKHPENIFLGPDENMPLDSIEWIANYAKKCRYPIGTSFITSKPYGGVNHKKYGVTSSGLNVYVEEVLKFIGIDPYRDPFTVKMSGGPDGDVAGNEILNLAKLYPKTAKLVALTDGTGTIYDPEGLHLESLVHLFHQGEGIAQYPGERLHEGGLLVNKLMKRNQTPFVQQTLCLKKEKGVLVEDWLGGSEVNDLLKHLMHSTSADLFIPAGGRPRTLNESNWQIFLNKDGKPSAKAIVEGANLYLDSATRKNLEKMGVLIIKDSSANKGGVICSSYEELCGLVISDETFERLKDKLIPEIMERVRQTSFNEARLLLKSHQETGRSLLELSALVSERMNAYADEILNLLNAHPLPENLNHPLMQQYLNYWPPTIHSSYTKDLLERVPDPHKKAIIACQLASQAVYIQGLDTPFSAIQTLKNHQFK